jgi:hypothetical protein
VSATPGQITGQPSVKPCGKSCRRHFQTGRRFSDGYFLTLSAFKNVGSCYRGCYALARTRLPAHLRLPSEVRTLCENSRLAMLDIEACGTTLTSAEAQQRAQSELQAGESLVWSGVPDAWRAAIAAIPETITPGIAFLGIALLLTIQGYDTATSMRKMTSHNLSPMLMMLAFTLPALIAGSSTCCGPCGSTGRGSPLSMR